MKKNESTNSAMRNVTLQRLKEVKLSDIKALADNATHIRLTKLQWALLIAGIAAAAVLIAWLMRPREVAQDYPIVAVEAVTTDDVSIYGEYVGRIRAQQFVEIRARVEGYLEKMLFDEGTYVKRGQTLFIIDPKLYQAHVASAKARLNKARAQAL